MEVEVLDTVSLAVGVEGLEKLKSNRLASALVRDVQVQLESVNVDLNLLLRVFFLAVD